MPGTLARLNIPPPGERNLACALASPVASGAGFAAENCQLIATKLHLVTSNYSSKGWRAVKFSAPPSDFLNLQLSTVTYTYLHQKTASVRSHFAVTHSN